MHLNRARARRIEQRFQFAPSKLMFHPTHSKMEEDKLQTFSDKHGSVSKLWTKPSLMICVFFVLANFHTIVRKNLELFGEKN
jgi:hypothetical protein